MQRLKALFDGQAWLLILPSVIGLALIDPAMVRTMLEWMLFTPVMIGIAIIISRLAFPQIKLGQLVDEAMNGNTAAGLVVLGLLLFFGMLLLALAGWGKP